MEKLSDDELTYMGKERRVRAYSCVFYVLVFDQTSTGAKERWKRATENFIGGSIYRTTAKTAGSGQTLAEEFQPLLEEHGGSLAVASDTGL